MAAQKMEVSECGLYQVIEERGSIASISARQPLSVALLYETGLSIKKQAVGITWFCTEQN